MPSRAGRSATTAAGPTSSDTGAGSTSSPAKLDRAEAWFERWGDWAVFLGRITPVVRSFISIPAGVFRFPFGRYTVLTLIGSAIWCFVLAGVGWAAGSSWESFHQAFRYADVAIAVAVVLAAAWLGRRYLRGRAAARESA